MRYVKEDILAPNDAESARNYPGRVSTEAAAKFLRVTPRTVRNYIEQGRLQAIAQGEGVEKTWLVSVESLRTLRDTRGNTAQKPRERCAEPIAEDMFRELAERLEVKAGEVGELRARLEMMERVESALREERRRLIKDLERERERADQERGRAKEAQRIAEQLVQERRQAREEARRLQEVLEEAERGKGFWRGLFGE